MDPLEEGAVHQAMPQGTIEHETQTSEEAQLATDRPQTNDRRKIHMPVGDVIPGTGVMRVKEETIPAIRTGGKIQSLYQWQSCRGYLEPMNVVKSPERFLRNQDARKTNLMAVMIPG